MEKKYRPLQDTEAFMHGELDNVTVQQNCIVLDLVQGGYVPYGCYTSAPISMPVFDALRVSWNAASPRGHGCGGPGPRTGGRQLDAVEQLWQVEPQSAPGKARPIRRAGRCSAGLTACSLTANTPRRCSCASTFTPKMRR